MSEAAVQERDAVDSLVGRTSVDIVEYATENSVKVLTDEKTYAGFLKIVEAEVSSHVPDVETEKGRKAIGSLAYRVTRSKTAIDAAGKKLNEDARAQIAKVDTQRRKVREELDAIAERARQPLTEWEAAEKERVRTAADILEKLEAAAEVSIEDGSNMIADRIGDVEAIEIAADVFRENVDYATGVKNRTLSALRAALARARQHEADQAELARLREEREERERQEREAREKAEAEEREQLRQARIAAEQKAREEAAARVAREQAEREAAAKIAAAEAEARRIKEEAERKERQRQEDEARMRREEEARAADRKHRGEVMGAAKMAIMTCGANEDTAKKIVMAIVAGEIPNVVLKF